MVDEIRKKRPRLMKKKFFKIFSRSRLRGILQLRIWLSARIGKSVLS